VRFLYSKVALLIALQFAYSQAYSQDDDLDEFDWDDVRIEVESGTTQSPNNDSWDFTFNIRSNYDYGDRDANNINSQLQGDIANEDEHEADVDIAASLHWSQRFGNKFQARFGFEFDHEISSEELTSDTIGESIRLDQAFIQYQPVNQLALRAGNLVLPFGTADAFRILDRFNPQDDRNWSLEDTNTRRVPVPALHLNFDNTKFRAQLGVGIGFRSNRLPEPGDEYDQFLVDRESALLHEQNDVNQYRPEWVLSGQYFGKGFDISLVLGDTFSRAPVLRGIGVEDAQVALETYFPRSLFGGVSGSFSKNSWLLRSDVVWLKNKSIFLNNYFENVFANPALAESNFSTQTVEATTGVEFTGISNTLIFGEVHHAYLADHEDSARQDRNTTGLAIGFTTTAMSEKLSLTARVIELANLTGHISQISAHYRLSDRSLVRFKWLEFNASDDSSFFYDYRNNDKALLEYEFIL